MPATLSLYIARRLLLSIGFAFLAIFTLIVLIDFVELIQDASSSKTATIVDIVILAFERAPLIAEQVFPFMVLFGAIGAFVSLSRRMELVVARGTGVSIWQMLAPALLAAAFLGVAVTAVYNPLATGLKEQAEAHEAVAFGKSSRRGGARWLRQQSVDGQSVMRAAGSTDRGRELTGVTVFVFSPSGSFQERIEAESAVLGDGVWELRSVRILRPGVAPESHPVFLLPTNLTADQVAETVSEPETISFWELPQVITLWEKTGIRTERFRLQYQSLIARPALYATMVLIAATVSLGFSRLGGVWKAILGGVIAGFVLYVAGEMSGDLGAAGFITPWVAAWAPPIVGTLLSVTVLLYQEDG